MKNDLENIELKKMRGLFINLFIENKYNEIIEEYYIKKKDGIINENIDYIINILNNGPNNINEAYILVPIGLSYLYINNENK